MPAMYLVNILFTIFLYRHIGRVLFNFNGESIDINHGQSGGKYRHIVIFIDR
jgi:hypothetical protein